MTGFAVAKELAAERQRPLVVLTSSRSASEFGALLSLDHAQRFIAKSDLTAAALAALVSEAA
jgi:hypothetical protein